MDKVAKNHMNASFYYLNTTNHQEFVKNASITAPAISVHSPFGVQFLKEPKTLDRLLQYSSIEPDFDSVFFVSDEEDLILFVEEFGSSLVIFAQSKCPSCDFVLLQLL